uniref:Anaphase-promoting complex subunit 4 WD40 domain-containing protein n=1 Tax=Pyramimonas obovata TaxID=1411642 RepID=A0A7S0WUL3_9CHLO
MALLKGHKGTVAGVAFTADGTKLVTGGGDCSVRVWNAATGGALLVLQAHRGDGQEGTSAEAGPDGHTGPVTAVAVSPDGVHLASASEDTTLRLWDLCTGLLQHVLAGHSDAVTGATFTPDAAALVSGSRDQSVRVWDVLSGAQTHIVEHPLPVVALALSRTGAALATVHAGLGKEDSRSTSQAQGGVYVWAVAPGHIPEEPRLLEGPEAGAGLAGGVAWSPAGDRVVAAYESGALRVWDAQSGCVAAALGGEELGEAGPAGTGRAVAFSSDGKRVVCGSAEGAVWAWDPSTPGDIWRLEGHTGWAECLATSEDGTRLLSGSSDGTVRVWDAEALRRRPPRSHEGHRGEVRSLALSGDGSMVLSASADRTIRVWDAASMAQRCTLHGHAGPVVCVATSTPGSTGQEGAMAVSCAEDATIRFWSLAGAGRLLASCHLDKAASCVAVSCTGELAVAGVGTQVLVFNGHGKLCAEVTEPVALEGHKGSVLAVAVSRDGSLVASAGADAAVMVHAWDLSRNTAAHSRVLLGHAGPVTSLAVSWDGQRIVSSSTDANTLVWDVQTGRAEVQLALQSTIPLVAAFSPDASVVATGMEDGSVVLWEVATAQGLLMIRTGAPLGALALLARSPACKVVPTSGVPQLRDLRVVTGHSDKSVRMWDAATGVPLFGAEDCSGILRTPVEGFMVGHTGIMEVESALQEEDVKKRSQDKRPVSQELEREWQKVSETWVKDPATKMQGSFQPCGIHSSSQLENSLSIKDTSDSKKGKGRSSMEATDIIAANTETSGGWVEMREGVVDEWIRTSDDKPSSRRHTTSADHLHPPESIPEHPNEAIRISGPSSPSSRDTAEYRTSAASVEARMEGPVPDITQLGRPPWGVDSGLYWCGMDKVNNVGMVHCFVKVDQQVHLQAFDLVRLPWSAE